VIDFLSELSDTRPFEEVGFKCIVRLSPSESVSFATTFKVVGVLYGVVELSGFAFGLEFPVRVLNEVASEIADSQICFLAS
jgi:hypothetical protein